MLAKHQIRCSGDRLFCFKILFIYTVLIKLQCLRLSTKWTRIRSRMILAFPDRPGLAMARKCAGHHAMALWLPCGDSKSAE